MTALAEAAREWAEARDVIACYLGKLLPFVSCAVCEEHAAAILARLAAHRPPIVTVYAEDTK